MRFNALVIGSLILATMLGVFGQDLSYYMSESFMEISPVTYLTVLTVISVFLYVLSFVVTYIAYKKQGNKNDKFYFYFLAIGLIGISISLWSVFVLAIWWG